MLSTYEELVSQVTALRKDITRILHRDPLQLWVECIECPVLRLYTLEESLSSRGACAEEIRRERQSKALPIMSAMEAWMEAVAPQCTCIYLKKLTHTKEFTMYQLHTEKQRLYFHEVIRLHYEEGYGEDRIEKLLPIGHTTVSRWIAIFAKEKEKISGANNMTKPQAKAEIKAEFYDEIINVAEAKFKLPIRKKAGAKQ